MEDLERILPAGVQVTALEPSRGKDGRITLHLRVSGQRERSVELVRNMEKSRRFVSPRLSSENAENNAQGALQPVQETGRVTFDILAEYNPATLEERRMAIAAQKRAHPGSIARPGFGPGTQPGVESVSRSPQPGGANSGRRLPFATPPATMRQPPQQFQGMGPGSLPNGRMIPPVPQNSGQAPGAGGPQ
jgi:type IV pilus assembly protein PilN